MKILLIDIDSTIPNLALMKVAEYYKRGGHIVGWNVDAPDMAYISCIFVRNRNRAISCTYMLKLLYPDIEIDIGGPGYSLSKVLPQQIEDTPPDYDIYPNCDYSLGFTTRGCIRSCSFCIVPQKEGHIKFIQPIEKVHDKRHKAIKLLDNNVLAMPSNFKRICSYCVENNLRVDFSQGLDARLLNDDLAHELAKVKPLSCFDFAFDSLEYEQDVRKAVSLLKKHGIHTRNKVQFYVYTTKDMDGPTGIKSALKRCEILRELGTNPYIMLNIDEETSQIMRDLKRWANRKPLFWSTDFREYKGKYKNLTW